MKKLFSMLLLLTMSMIVIGGQQIAYDPPGDMEQVMVMNYDMDYTFETTVDIQYNCLVCERVVVMKTPLVMNPNYNESPYQFKHHWLQLHIDDNTVEPIINETTINLGDDNTIYHFLYRASIWKPEVIVTGSNTQSLSTLKTDYI